MKRKYVKDRVYGCIGKDENLAISAKAIAKSLNAMENSLHAPLTKLLEAGLINRKKSTRKHNNKRWIYWRVTE